VQHFHNVLCLSEAKGMDIKMKDSKPIIAMGFKAGGENGGPYVSHKRIMESKLQEKYDIRPLYFPEGRMGLFCPKYVKEVRKAIGEMNPDIVQIPGLQLLGFHMMVAALLEKKKTIMVVHGSSREAQGFSKIKKFILMLLEEFSLYHATKIYTVSEYVSGWDVLKKYKKKCYGTIYNLSQKKDYEPQNIREQLGINKDDLVIVSTGRIVKEKGYDNLLFVIRELHLDSHAKFIIAGEGDYLNEMKEKIKLWHLEKQVFFLGYRNDIENVLDAANIFVLLSKHETLCISVLEACKHGIACVSTDVGGIPEIINNDKTGILVDCNNVIDAVQAIKLLMSNTQKRNEMGACAQKYVSEKFSEDKIIAQLDDLYRSLLDDNKQ